jgi:hypothetical protein
VNSKKSDILPHFIVVLIIGIIEWLSEPDFMWVLINFANFLGMFYLNYFLIGKFLLKKPRTTTFVLWCAINILLVYLVFLPFLLFGYHNQVGDFPSINQILSKSFENAIYGFRHFSPICLAGFVYKHWYRNRDKNKELETVKTSYQIQVLKNGFSIDLVNKILSEMEVKALRSPKSIEEEVLLLSNLLRYKLYESSAPKVSASKEIDIANDQISIHNSLFNSNFKLVNELDSDIEIKTGNILNALDDLLKKFPKQDLRLIVKLSNNQCFLSAVNETKNIEENFQLN